MYLSAGLALCSVDSWTRNWDCLGENEGSDYPRGCQNCTWVENCRECGGCGYYGCDCCDACTDDAP